MAGAGYKLFNTGDVLTAAQVNTYLQEQVVMRFATTAARTTALSGVLAEGMVSYIDATDTLEVYNGSAWVSAIGDLTEIAAGTGITVTNGTGPIPTVAIDSTVATLTGSQTLTNKTINGSANTISNVSLTTGVTGTLPIGNGGTNLTTFATGDLPYASAANTLAKLAIGTTGQVLTVSGGVPTWATAGGASGLTLITRQTVTNAADTGNSFNNVFSSTYDTYFIIIENLFSSTNNLQMQLKTSGGTSTANYYGNSAYYAYNGSTWSFVSSDNASQFTIFTGGSQVHSSAFITMNGVGNTSERALWSGIGHEGYQNRNYHFGGEIVTDATYTGLLFKMNSGNITITASVYGLAK